MGDEADGNWKRAFLMVVWQQRKTFFFALFPFPYHYSKVILSVVFVLLFYLFKMSSLCVNTKCIYL